MEVHVLWLAVPVLAAFSILALAMKALDLPGSLSAFLMGLVVVVSVGVQWVVLLLLFAAGGSLVSRVGRHRKAGLPGAGGEPSLRGWRNVLGNGLAATLVAALGWVLDPQVLAFPFAAAVAVAAADTFASELGCLSDKTVLVTRPSRRVPAGTDGGVSWLGTISGTLAAGIVAVVAVVVLPLGWGWAVPIMAAGTFGSLLDSVLGAWWERSAGNPDGFLSKTHVNLVATSLTAGLALLLGVL